MSKRVTVSVPATSANLGPGFDTLGMALSLRNQFTMTEVDGPTRVTIDGFGDGILPTDESNLVYRAADRVFRAVGYQPSGVHIALQNNIPVSSGLGSSSSAIVGGMMAANALAGSPMTPIDLLDFATDMEGHPDNVTPALFGGVTVTAVHDGRPIYYNLNVTKLMKVAVVLPQFPLSTQEARAILPAIVPLKDAVFNVGRIALLIRAFETADYDLLSIAMHDRLHQQYRFRLVPGLEFALDQARAAGAAGGAISGSGPGIIIFAPDGHDNMVAAAEKSYAQVGLTCQTWILDLSLEGATVIA